MRLSLSTIICSCAMIAASGSIHAAKIWTVDELVDKNIEARGGITAIRAMKSLKLTGKLLLNQGQFEMAIVQTFKRPAQVRFEATVQGLTQTQVYDGKSGWQINPFNGRKDPERLSGDDSKGLAEAASEFDGSLVDWKAKGATVNYLGTEDVDGTLAHKIKLSRPNGDVEYIFLDPDHFLEIRTLSQRIEHGVQLAIETDLGDYEKVNGVYIPFAMETGKQGSSDKQKTVINKAEVNPAVDDAVFAFPATKSKK
jgi:hypothetical protein